MKDLDILNHWQTLWIDIQIFTVMVFQHILPFYVMILYHHGGKDQAQILKPASSPLARNIIKIQNSILGGTAKINVTIKDLKVQRWSSSHPQLSHHLALQK